MAVLTREAAPDRPLCPLPPVLDPALTSRFHYWVSPIVTRFISGYADSFYSESVEKFRPEAVLTVVWGYSWLVAAAYAKKANIPLHLVVHDDWGNFDDRRHPGERRLIERRLRSIYRDAASRLCVSPYMEETYRKLYGVAGDVLYPARAMDIPVFGEPPASLRGPCKPFTIAFAGSVFLEYARALKRVAQALQRFGGRVIVFGPLYDGAAEFLNEPNIDLRGKVRSPELIRTCREEGHAVFVPMSYRERDRSNMEISFPSKLTDASAIGIPIIIDGPEYCSAVRWARGNDGVAEVCTEENIEALERIISRLQDPAHRLALGTRALRCGDDYFSAARANATLRATLQLTAA